VPSSAGLHHDVTTPLAVHPSAARAPSASAVDVYDPMVCNKINPGSRLPARDGMANVTQARRLTDPWTLTPGGSPPAARRLRALAPVLNQAAWETRYPPRAAEALENLDVEWPAVLVVNDESATVVTNTIS